MAASLVGCEPNLLSTAGGQTEKLSTRRLKERHRAWGDLVTGGSNRFEDYPRHSMRPVYYWYIYLHLLDFYGKCRYIYYTLSIWVWKIVPQFFLGVKLGKYLENTPFWGTPIFGNIHISNRSPTSKPTFPIPQKTPPTPTTVSLREEWLDAPFLRTGKWNKKTTPNSPNARKCAWMMSGINL